MKKMTDIKALTITNPANWTKEELYTNLQAAVDVELWTIPLYLSALYSIEGLNSNNQLGYPTAAKLIESVVIEEMLHLQLASNICNALGYTPQMNFPTYKESEGIPFIRANVPAQYQGYQVKLGGLDLNQLKLFCVIELPEPNNHPDWTKQTKYNSIGELYQALEIAVTAQWNALYVGDANNNRQQANFTDYINKYNAGDGFSQIVNSLDTAITAMHAIVDQGEGATDEEIEPQFQPPAESTNPADYDPSDYDPADSHFKKFNTILGMIQGGGGSLPLTYPLIPHPDKQQLANQEMAQRALQTAFTTFIGELQAGFSTPTTNNQLPAQFYTDMFNMQNMITAVWQTGAVPSFPSPQAASM